MRVGEAKNPGPSSTPWRLQLRNIVSANAHLDELIHGADSCIAWTETSATPATQQALRKLAKRWRSMCSTSAPAPTRNLKGIACMGRGSSTGTLCYTPKQRQQSLHRVWDSVIWATGRVSDSLLHMDGFQLRVIVVYGYHCKVPNSTGLNEQLFQSVHQQATDFQIPTMVVGDFNIDLQELEAWAFAQTKSFADVALWDANTRGESQHLRIGTSLDWTTSRSTKRLSSSFVVSTKIPTATRTMQFSMWTSTDHLSPLLQDGLCLKILHLFQAFWSVSSSRILYDSRYPILPEPLPVLL